MAIQKQKILDLIDIALGPDRIRQMHSFVVCEQQRDALIFRMPEGLQILDEIWEIIQEVCEEKKVVCRKEGVFASLVELDNILGNIKWLWRNWIPKGSVSLLVGDPGSNKSMIAMDLVKIITNGGVWPLTNDEQPPGNVVWIEAEAGYQMLRQRAKAMKIDTRRVYLGNFDGDIVGQPDFSNENHQRQLDALVKAKRPELIVVDSLTGINKGGENRIEEIRPILQFLLDIATSDIQPAILMVHHLRKTVPGESIEIELNKIRGSGGIVALARSILGLEKQDTRRVIRHVKGNYAAPQQPIVASPYYENVGTELERMSIRYSAYESPAPKQNKTEKCALWIVSIMREYGKREMPLAEIIRQGSEQGYSRQNINSAKEYLGDQIEESGTGRASFWSFTQDTESIYEISMMQKEMA